MIDYYIANPDDESTYFGDMLWFAMDIYENGVINVNDLTFLDLKIAFPFDPSYIPYYTQTNWLEYADTIVNLDGDRLNYNLATVAMGDYVPNADSYLLNDFDEFGNAVMIPFSGTKNSYQFNDLFNVSNENAMVSSNRDFTIPVSYVSNYDELLGAQIGFSYPSDKFILKSAKFVNSESNKELLINMSIEQLNDLERNNCRLYDDNGRVTMLYNEEPYSYFDIERDKAFIEFEFEAKSEDIDIVEEFDMYGLTSIVVENGFVELTDVELQRPSLQYATNLIVNSNVDHDISVYPNPAKENLFVELDLSSAYDVEVSLVDVLGRKVIQTEKAHYIAGTTHTSLFVGDLTPGVYSVEIKLFEGQTVNVVTKKIIIQ
jgi:hypothetical protein